MDSYFPANLVGLQTINKNLSELTRLTSTGLCEICTFNWLSARYS